VVENEQTYREKITRIRQRLIGAFGEPVWRTPLPPVDELVSTILSQNTNDVNRDTAFERLKAAFPNWESVMNAIRNLEEPMDSSTYKKVERILDSLFTPLPSICSSASKRGRKAHFAFKRCSRTSSISISS